VVKGQWGKWRFRKDKVEPSATAKAKIYAEKEWFISNYELDDEVLKGLLSVFFLRFWQGRKKNVGRMCPRHGWGARVRVRHAPLFFYIIPRRLRPTSFTRCGSGVFRSF